MKFWTLSKMIRFFSYLLCEINSNYEFITLNLSKFGAFLTIWSWIQIFEQCQKCSDCAHILFIKSTHQKNSSHQIWAQLEHFWHCSKICIQLQIVKNAPNLLKFNVMNSFCEFISHNKYEKHQRTFDQMSKISYFMSKILGVVKNALILLLFGMWNQLAKKVK